jgi:hypothetical protein
MDWIIKKTLIGFINVYQSAFSIFFGPCCRFTPSCSNYAWQSVQRFGALKGTWLTLKRLLRCHPFHPGGYDPVPEVTPVHPLNAIKS